MYFWKSSSKNILKSEFNQIVVWLAFLNVSANHFVVLYFWIWVLKFVLDNLETCLEASFDDQVIWNAEKLEGEVRCCLNKEIECLEFDRWIFSLRLSTHSCPPIVFRNLDVLKVCYKHIPIVLEHFATLTEELNKHFIVVDECGDCVGENDTVNFLRHGKAIFEYVVA